MRPAWPVAALLIGYPAWWALGLGGLSVVALAIPMALYLMRRRPVCAPKGFGLWLLLLAAYLVSSAMLHTNPPGAYGEFGPGRLIGYGMRLLIYVALLIIVLYIGNLTEEELPRLRLVRMLGVLFVTTVAGGLLGVLAPGLEFTSPVEHLLPDWLADNSFVHNLVHPTAAQTQYVLGYPSPRPEAPFEWANAWGSNASVLLIWFVVGWWVYGGAARRLVAIAIIAAAAVPIVYSLNRGLWIGLVVSVAFLGLRLVPRVTPLRSGLAVVVAAAAVVFVASPLARVVQERIDNPHSNDVRAFTMTQTLAAASQSPVIGYGSTRYTHGNHRSVTTGRTQWCDECGHPPLGADGQLWLLLISQGFVGAALYVAFFAGAIRRYWRDTSPIGVAGTLIMLLVLIYMLIYDALVTPLSLYLVSFALLWRNDTDRARPVRPPRRNNPVTSASGRGGDWREERAGARDERPSGTREGAAVWRPRAASGASQ